VSLLSGLVSPSLALPLIVFLTEACVVTVGTIRIIFVSRGRRFLAPILGFFEVCLWLFAIGQTMQNLSNPACFIAFAAGFTTGNFFGVLVEKRLALGTVVVRIITHRDTTGLVEQIQGAGYGVTLLDGQGSTGRVTVVFTVVPRRDLARLTTIIKGIDPRLFYSVDEIQSASEGIFPVVRGRSRLLGSGRLRLFRPAA
jgi:uncharacterized protein YebE (UPF0316 family)